MSASVSSLILLQLSKSDIKILSISPARLRLNTCTDINVNSANSFQSFWLKLLFSWVNLCVRFWFRYLFNSLISSMLGSVTIFCLLISLWFSSTVLLIDQEKSSSNIDKKFFVLIWPRSLSFLMYSLNIVAEISDGYYKVTKRLVRKVKKCCLYI